jgi:uncharacterized phosphosugar-binding protein
MGKLADQYLAEATRLQKEACEKNKETLEKLGPIIGKSLADGGILHTFGSGHSDIIGREIIGRAGGLVCISGIQDPTAGFIENLNGYGSKLAERYARFYGMKEGEVIIVISNSGKNASPIEVALEAKKRGLTVVAVTCMAMSQEVASQHASGKKLYEVADYVLDNNGVTGDAIVPLPGTDVKAGPTSTLTGAILLNLLQMEVIEYLAGQNLPLPLLRSQNLEGAMEKNQELAAKYNRRLSRPI